MLHNDLAEPLCPARGTNPETAGGIAVRALRVYRYRQARVHGPKLPRDLLGPLQEACCKQVDCVADNHQLIVMMLDSTPSTRCIVAILFHDSVAIVGKPEDVIVESW